jgi:DNA-damage-inducible protein J
MPESSVTGNALPFEPLNPNAETIAAMKAARSRELFVAGEPDDLLQSLDAGDSIRASRT